MTQQRDVRFWAKVEKTATCWLWRGARKPSGYGNVQRRPRTLLAHRLAYELLVGPIPEGLTIDHLCRNRGCVNPAHMELVTAAENTRRQLPWSAERQAGHSARMRSRTGWHHSAEAKRKMSDRKKAAA